MMQCDGAGLSGCIEKNGNLGKVEVTPFMITIKGLDADYDFKHQFERSDWDQLIGFLQHKAIQFQNSPV